MRKRVCVVGAGLAGSSAAVRAAQLGQDVVLLDSQPDTTAGGNTSLSGGGIHVRGKDLRSKPELLTETVLSRGWGHTRWPLVERFVATAPDAHAWLTGTGVRFQPKEAALRTELIPAETFLDPKRDMTDVDAWPERGPQLALRTLQDTLQQAGGVVRGSAAATALSRDAAGRIDGVRLDDGSTVPADAVILADGGFQANMALRKRFIGPQSEHFFLRGATSGVGTGLLMAEELGAHIANPEWFYGHVLHRDVFDNDRLWPWPSLDGMLVEGGVLVDARGRRFTDEGRSGIHINNALGWSEDPAGAWAIVDASIWAEMQDTDDPVPSNPGLVERGGRIVRAATVEALAGETGLDAQVLAETLATYNEAASAGRTQELPILRTCNARPLAGELIAFPAAASITYTTGGVSIDAEAGVLDADGERIPGLFAAGGTAAGPTAGYFGGLATALVFGYIAGSSSAAG